MGRPELQACLGPLDPDPRALAFDIGVPLVIIDAAKPSTSTKRRTAPSRSATCITGVILMVLQAIVGRWPIALAKSVFDHRSGKTMALFE